MVPVVFMYELFRSLFIASRFFHEEDILSRNYRKTTVVLVLVSRFFPSEWQNDCHLSWRVVVAVVTSHRRLISWSLNLEDVRVFWRPGEKLRTWFVYSHSCMYYNFLACHAQYSAMTSLGEPIFEKVRDVITCQCHQYRPSMALQVNMQR